MPLKASGHASKGAERRRETRQRAVLSADAILLNAVGTPVFAVRTRDLSTHGIGFFSQREFFLGEHFAVALRVPGQVGKLILCVVRYCSRTAPKEFEVGAELLESISLDKSGINIPARWLDRAKNKD